MYLRARVYDPGIGRFTQQDGWEYADHKDPLSLNLYTYCGNNPIRFFDPSGHNSIAADMPFWMQVLEWLKYNVPNIAMMDSPMPGPADAGALIVGAGGLILVGGAWVWDALDGDNGAPSAPSKSVGGTTPANPQPPKDPKRDNIQKKIDSLNKQLKEHQQKLNDYKQNPDAHDNKGFLKNAKTQQQRESIINGRIHELDKQIATFTRDIIKLYEQLGIFLE